ncbi:MAG: hypothetical protein NTU53_20750 [Planctomycetota bacterium]|nr:hypothetical protein [Planctomycetota bacterium]
MSGQKMVVGAFVGILLMVGSFAMAQAAGGGGGGGRGNRGGGNFDPAQMRQRMMDRMKEQLGATDDEWKVLMPKIEKVMQAQRDSRGGGFGGMGGRGGRGGNDQAPETAIGKAAQDLRTTLENKDAKADEISAKLKAYREARESAQQALAQAQKELKEVLTLRQEAILVLDGNL